MLTPLKLTGVNVPVGAANGVSAGAAWILVTRVALLLAPATSGADGDNGAIIAATAVTPAIKRFMILLPETGLDCLRLRNPCCQRFANAHAGKLDPSVRCPRERNCD